MIAVRTAASELAGARLEWTRNKQRLVKELRDLEALGIGGRVASMAS
jgi:hypothetical protein